MASRGGLLPVQQSDLSSQSSLAQNMIATMGREAAISACWANEWLGVLEEIYAFDRAAQHEADEV